MSRVAWRTGVTAVFIAALDCGGGSGRGDDAGADVPVDNAVAVEALPHDSISVADKEDGDDAGVSPSDEAPEARAPDTLDSPFPAEEVISDAWTPDAGGKCLPPAQWWADFALPKDPKQGIEPGPPIVWVCMEPMPDAFFECLCPEWGPEVPTRPGEPPIEVVQVYYDTEKNRLLFMPGAPDGFALRSDGVGVNWYGDPTDGLVIRLDFSLSRARFLHFERGTGKFYGESALVPLTGPVCLSSQ